jgi:hypothetical protein
MKYNIENLVTGAINKFALDLQVCLPVTVKKYYGDEFLADVQPDIDTFFSDGSVIEAPIIKGVPINFPMASGKFITFPLSKGDKGVIIVSQRDLDSWKVGEGRIPADSALYQLSNAFLIPGVSHKSMIKDAKKGPKKAMVINSDKMFIGDVNQKTEVILSAKGTAVAGVLGPLAPTNIPSGQLDLLQIMESFLTLMKNCSYGQLAQGGGGGIDIVTSPLLDKLIADIKKIKA